MPPPAGAEPRRHTPLTQEADPLGQKEGNERCHSSLRISEELVSFSQPWFSEDSASTFYWGTKRGGHIAEIDRAVSYLILSTYVVVVPCTVVIVF